MEIEHTTTKNQVTIKFSIIYALANVGISLIFYIMGAFESNWILTVLSMVINASILFFAMKSRKNDTLGGFMSYGQALGTGMLVTVFGALIVTAYTYLFHTVIDPEFINKMLEVSKTQMIQKEMSEEQIEQAMEMTKKFMTPGLMSLFGYLTSLFLGLIISLVLAAVTKNENPNAAYQKLDS